MQMKQTLLTALSLSFLATAVTGAVLETEITPQMAEMGCTARLTGMIEPGDLDRIQPFLETTLTSDWGEPDSDNDLIFRNFTPATDYGDGFFTHRLCLNSPGGSLAESLRIIEFFRDHASRTVGGIQTAVADGDSCESACAYVFLAGRFVRFSGNENYEGRPNHLLHPGGRLGLTAPAPQIGAGSHSAAEISQLWQTAMTDLSRVAGQIANGNIFLSDDLFAEMLTHQPPRMLTIETVGQALQWGLEIEPNPIHVGRYPYSADEFAHALCENAAALAPDYVDLKATGPGATIDRDAEGNVTLAGGFVDLHSGRHYSCHLDAFEWNSLQLTLQDASEDWVMRRLRWNGACNYSPTFVAQDENCYECDIPVEAPCMAAFPPETRLLDLTGD